MKDILSSKLYVSSSRKDKILAAIQDPNNEELVKQVTEYLDDEFIDSRYLNPHNNATKEPEVPDVGDNSEELEDKSSGTGRSTGGGFASSGFSSMDDIFDEGNRSENNPEDDDDLDNEPVQDDDVAVEEPPIDSSKVIKASIVLDVVKGTLNARQDTAGVDRVVEKDSELWIYYNDSVNLNKVMSEAAQELILKGYSMLEFNRLARSNNAIVFDIVKQSSGGA